MSNVIEISTNNETTRVRDIFIGKQKVLLRKARTEVNASNAAVLSFLELMNDLNPAMLDDEKKTILIIQDENKSALHKRPEKGLLAGMWELPNEEGTFTLKQAKEWAYQHFGDDSTLMKLENAKHIFTHVEWHMTGYVVTVKGDGMADFVWADYEKLTSLAVPSAFQKYDTACREILTE